MLILDTNAIIAGIELKGAIPPAVMEEIRENTLRLKLEIAISQGDIRVISPSMESLNKVLREAEKTGDELSRADTEILALALDVSGILVTDDYAVQNIAKRLGIEFREMKEIGIKKVIEWKKVCRGCGREYPPDYRGVCTECGNRVVRRIRKTFK